MKFSRRIIRLLVIGIVASCVLSFANETSTGAVKYRESHPVVSAFTESISDEFEGFNRAMEDTNSHLVRGILYPLSQVYNGIVPKCVSDCLSRFADNLKYPCRLINNCLQGEFGDAWEETARFVINSTVGLAGLFDPAKSWGFEKHDADFGETLAKWGIGTGSYLNLPLAGPMNIRDAVGSIGNVACRLTWYLSPYNWFLTINDSARSTDYYYDYFNAYPYSYSMTRCIMSLVREGEMEQILYMPKLEDCQPDESLGYLLLAPKEDHFDWKEKHLCIRMDGAKHDLNFTLYEQPKSDGRLMFILPGIGTHRDSADVDAMAELFYNQGWSVVTLSSTFDPDYIRGVPFGPPGIISYDAEVLHKAMAMIREKVMKRLSVERIVVSRPSGGRGSSTIGIRIIDKPRKLTNVRTVVFGTSLGAINTLWLAARQDAGDDSLHADRFIAVNPPRNPMNALGRLDEFFDIPLSWPEGERHERTVDVIRRVGAALLGNGGSQIPLMLDESRMLVGANIKFTLVDVASEIHSAGRDDVLKAAGIRTDTLGHLERDAFAMRFQDYVKNIAYAFAVKNGIVDGNETVEDLSKKLSLDGIEGALRRMESVRLFHVENDPLLDSGDIDWFKGTFGSRAVIVPRGGHLGNLISPEVQEILLKMVE